ncbi:MAG: sporulation protein [Clostridia bacterium]|nr:sporulation protein [Clostridia bacterium]
MEKRNTLSQLIGFCTACLIILFGAGLILCTRAVSAAAAQAIGLCARVVIPSLFPFMVLSSLCLSSGVGNRISRLFARPMEVLFRLPGNCAPAVILGWIGGYPVGARTVFDLYDRRLCTKEEAARLLTFCSCCGPAFLCGAVGTAIFGSREVGILLWLCHIIAALIIGMVQGRFLSLSKRGQREHTVSSTVSFARQFTQAVSTSFGAILNVCGFVIFFAALMALLEDVGLLAAAETVLFFLPEGMAAPLLRGLMEMTGGTAALTSSPLLTFPQAMALAAGIAGWGGLSIHAQVLSLREDRDIPMTSYFLGKAFHGILSAVLTYGISFYFLPAPTLHSAFAPMGRLSDMTLLNPAYYILVCGLYLAVCLIATALVLRTGEREEIKDSCQTRRKTV